MKKKTKIVTILAIFLLTAVFAVSGIFAQESFPTINVLCENKSGILRSFDDGFSMLKKCHKGERKVVLLGLQGEKGDQGEPGPEGPKGDPGDSGFTADKIIAV